VAQGKYVKAICVITLHLAPPCSFLQSPGLFRCPDAFLDDFQSEVMSQRNDGVRDRRNFGIGNHIVKEGAIHFEYIERKALQTGQAGILWAEIFTE
jgi:hypothetical protein